jgi:hypothetical protein
VLHLFRPVWRTDSKIGTSCPPRQKSSNNSPDNLAWLCLEHHDRYDGSTSQSKGITLHEVKRYRQSLWEAIENDQHHKNSQAQSQPTAVLESLCIENVPRPDSVINEKSRRNRIEKVLCFHLQVRNCNPPSTVRNCRVRLTRILRPVSISEWQDVGQFAVPRLMPWAPAEISPIERTFSACESFDFGALFLTLGIFELAKAADQGGAYEREFQGPGIRRYVFRIEADGCISIREHTVEVKIEASAPTSKWPFKMTLKCSAS